jgi:hypothetical protein
VSDKGLLSKDADSSGASVAAGSSCCGAEWCNISQQHYLLHVCSCVFVLGCSSALH